MAYGREDINELLEYLQLKLGDVPMDGSREMNRHQCKLLVDWAKKTYPNHDALVVVKRLVDIGTGDDFHKKYCNTMLYVHRHKGKFILAAKEQAASESKPQGGYRIV